MGLKKIRNELKKAANPIKAKTLERFFKTGKGEYGEGDIFLGVVVPKTREIAMKNKDLALEEVEKLLGSKVHEERLAALLLLVHNFQKGDEKTKEEIFEFYLKNTKKVNNWDLVDLSAPNIIGQYLINKDKSILYVLAKSDNLWERRISIISTYPFIKDNQFNDTTAVSEILLKDKHDLMHKAVGWMLREVGKRNLDFEEEFLRKNYKKMPRTMLRYAIEKFEEGKRRAYLEGRI